MNKIFAISLVMLMGLSGAFLWSQEGSEWEHEHGAMKHHVGTLVSDAFRGETWLIVEWADQARLDEPILIEDRDHGRRESAQVGEILGGHLILKEMLDGYYLVGSRLYQTPGQ
jgi:hypothetical protein